MAAAAYRSGEKLHSEYYGEDSDYTRKGGVICSEILLPPHAPPDEYSVLPEPGVRRVRATVPGSERRYIFRCCCASPPRELSMAAGSVVHGRHAFYMPVLTNI